MQRFVTIVGCAIVALAAPAAAQEEAPRALVRFLHEAIGLDSADVRIALRGEAVVTVLDTRVQRDVAIFGIVAVPLARAAYTRQMRDFATALRTPTRTHVGVFSVPAVPADVESVVISPRDVSDMRDCKPGDCVVKLPATDMQRIRADMNWSAPAAELQAQMNAYARRRLVEYVTDYRARGDAALAIYDDRRTAHVRASQAFAELLADSPFLYQRVPSMQRYFAAYPNATLPPDAAEVLFWAEEVLPRLRPILSVTHQIVYTPPELPEVTIVAAKQIYANHYFEAAIDLTCAVDRPGGIYLLVLRRYRFDNLPSGGLINIRGRAIGALRDQLRADLRRQQGER